MFYALAFLFGIITGWYAKQIKNLLILISNQLVQMKEAFQEREDTTGVVRRQVKPGEQVNTDTSSGGVRRPSPRQILIERAKAFRDKHNL